MRAARLVAVLLALQRNGRMTAADLAERLDVSPRTVLRDVEALSEAGIPVVTAQGAGGGIELLPGFRTALGELPAETAPGLLLAGHPLLASALGLGGAAAAARQVLLAALTPGQRAAASIDTWLLVDPGTPDAATAEALRTAARAVQGGLELTVDDGRVVQPLAVVLAGGRALLVHRTPPDGEPQVLALDGGTRLRPRPARFPRPEGFDLPRFWSAFSADRRTAGAAPGQNADDRSGMPDDPPPLLGRPG